LWILINPMETGAYKDLFERAKSARKAITCCKLCPRQCNVNRCDGETGYCKLDAVVRCFRDMIFYDEESELVPSHQVYFSGCNLRCEFCTVDEWNEQPWEAKEVDYELLAKSIANRRNQGCRNLNLLGGEPSINLHGILELLGRVDSGIKVVWNSNMYYNDIVDELISGLTDIYLADFKCGSDSCAEVMLSAGDYVKVVKKNIQKACEHGEVIIRHVIMPGHIDCCMKPVFSWIKNTVPQAKLSIRDNYVPPAQAVYSPKQYIKKEDVRKAIDLADSMGLKLIK
jgi:putative pyruvate formate lyase activating enzyme